MRDSFNLSSHPSSTPATRLQQLTKQFTTSTKKNEYNMASDNPQSHNNPDFQLSEIFNVKNRVAVVTGKLDQQVQRSIYR